MLQCSVVSNITMKGRLKRCASWRRAFLNIRDFFTEQCIERRRLRSFHRAKGVPERAIASRANKSLQMKILVSLLMPGVAAACGFLFQVWLLLLMTFGFRDRLPDGPPSGKASYDLPRESRLRVCDSLPLLVARVPDNAAQSHLTKADLRTFDPAFPQIEERVARLPQSLPLAVDHQW